MEENIDDLIKIVKKEISMRYAVFSKRPHKLKQKVEEMERVKKFLEEIKENGGETNARPRF